MASNSDMGRGAYSGYSGPGGGSNYTFRSTPSGGQGNWNTGGQVTATGSFQNGINQVPQRPTGGPKGHEMQGGLPGYAPPISPVMAPPVPQIPIPQQKPWGWLDNFNTPPQPLPGRNLSGWPGYVPGTQQADPTPYPGNAINPAGNTVFKNQNFPALSGPGGMTNNLGRRSSH